jgi:hypothetical protein
MTNQAGFLTASAGYWLEHIVSAPCLLRALGAMFTLERRDGGQKCRAAFSAFGAGLFVRVHADVTSRLISASVCCCRILLCMLALSVWSDANALPVYLDCTVITCLMRGYVRHYVVTLGFIIVAYAA